MYNHQAFIKAIEEKKLVKVRFNSFEKGVIERVCVPFDFVPSSRARNQENKYQFYDLNSPNGEHNLPLFPFQIVSINILQEVFDPAVYITWNAPYNWKIRREWGIYS